MEESVLDKAKLRLQAIEREADDLRLFIRMFAKLSEPPQQDRPALEVKRRPIEDVPAPVSARDFSSRDEIVGASREILRQVHPRPLAISDLFKALIDRGIRISGNNPKGNLSAKLSQPADIVYVRDEGWYYRPQEKEALDKDSWLDLPKASSSDQPAKGREAAPGGGP